MSIRFENLFTEAGMLARCILDEGERIASAQDFLELITNSPAPTIVLDRKDLPRHSSSCARAWPANAFRRFPTIAVALRSWATFPRSRARRSGISSTRATRPGR